MRTQFHVVRQASLNNLCKLTNEKTVLDVQKSRFGGQGMFEVIKDPNSRYFELKQNDGLAEILEKSTSKKKKKKKKIEDDQLSFINDDEVLDGEVDFDSDEVLELSGRTRAVTRGTELREIKKKLKTKDKEIEVKDEELDRLRKKLEAAGIEI